MLSKRELGELYGAVDVAITSFQERLRRVNRSIGDSEHKRQLAEDFTKRLAELDRLRGRLTEEIDAMPAAPDD